MKRAFAVLVVAACAATAGATAQSKPPSATAQGALKAEQVIASWKATPQDVARKMIAKYGEPQEVSRTG